MHPHFSKSSSRAPARVKGVLPPSDLPENQMLAREGAFDATKKMTGPDYRLIMMVVRNITDERRPQAGTLARQLNCGAPYVNAGVGRPPS